MDTINMEDPDAKKRRQTAKEIIKCLDGLPYSEAKAILSIDALEELATSAVVHASSGQSRRGEG